MIECHGKNLPYPNEESHGRERFLYFKSNNRLQACYKLLGSNLISKKLYFRSNDLLPASNKIPPVASVPMPMVMFDLKSTLKLRPTLSKINKRIKHNATLEAGLGIYFITVFIFAYI